MNIFKRLEKLEKTQSEIISILKDINKANSDFVKTTKSLVDIEQDVLKIVMLQNEQIQKNNKGIYNVCEMLIAMTKGLADHGIDYTEYVPQELMDELLK